MTHTELERALREAIICSEIEQHHHPHAQTTRILANQILILNAVAVLLSSDHEKAELREDGDLLRNRLREVLSLFEDPCPYDTATTLAVARAALKQPQAVGAVDPVGEQVTGGPRA